MKTLKTSRDLEMHVELLQMTLKPFADRLPAAGRNLRISKTIGADLVPASVQADFSPFKKHLSVLHFKPIQVCNPLFCLTMPKRQHVCTTMDGDFMTCCARCCVVHILTYVWYGISSFLMLCHVMLSCVMSCYILLF